MRKQWEAVLRFLLWMAVWEFISSLVKDKIPFAGPVTTVAALIDNALRKEFYIAVWTTFSGIALGFFAAMVIGTMLGYLHIFIKD